jgi:hypothetical protein
MTAAAARHLELADCQCESRVDTLGPAANLPLLELEGRSDLQLELHLPTTALTRGHEKRHHHHGPLLLDVLVKEVEEG